MRPWQARRWRLQCAGTLAILPLVAGARTVTPHLALKRSEPADSSRLTVAPTRISLWFTERPQLPFTRVRLTGPVGAVPLDALVADTGNAVHARISRPLESGSYRVQWQSGSADGHAMRGAFTFDVVAADKPVPTPDPARATPLQRAGRDESGSRTARWIEFVALLSVLGALGFRHGVLPPLAARNVPTSDAADRARRLGQSILLLYVVAAIVRLYLQSVAMNGRSAALDLEALTPIVTSTMWGFGWTAGTIGAAMVLGGWLVSRRSVAIGTPLALTGVLGMVMAPALSGHAATSPNFIWSVTLDMLHVAAAGVWLGGLLMVLIAGIPEMLRLPEGNRHAAVSALVHSFHPLALFCAPIAVLTGAGSAWINVGGPGDAWASDYGRLLALKIVLVGLVTVVGAYNSLRVRPTLSAAEGTGTRRFRVSGSIELTLGAVVLIVTTFLVVTPVPNP